MYTWKYWLTLFVVANVWGFICAAMNAPFWFNLWIALVLGWYWPRIYNWAARYVQKR